MTRWIAALDWVGLDCGSLELSGDVLFEAADPLLLRRAFVCPSFGGGASACVPAQPTEHDAVEDGLGLAAAVPLEPVTDCFPDEAGMGATPQSLAKAASEPIRSWFARR
jgi:hypothetical protein